MTCTQVGGKYHPDDDSVFRLKRRLLGLGVSVAHPIADGVSMFDGSSGFAFDLARQSFHEVEVHYYECIRTCDFHTVCNQFRDNIGYLGGSASLEMAYAMCHRRPIVALHPVTINDTVDERVRAFLTPRLPYVVVHDFLWALAGDSRDLLLRLPRRRIDYNV